MLQSIHVEINRAALADAFSPRALEAINTANVGQDVISGQIGHAEYHFDNNAFEKSYAYLEEQRNIINVSLQSKDISSAWSAFGRLTHTAQDFYAHSNYLKLWLARFDGNPPPAPLEVDPVDETLLHHPDLRSGKLYYPLELLTFIRVLKPYVKPLLPRDSHAWMNLDSPKQGPLFDYAFHAAVKRTRIEFDQTEKNLSQDLLSSFVDM